MALTSAPTSLTPRQRTMALPLPSVNASDARTRFQDAVDAVLDQNKNKTSSPPSNGTGSPLPPPPPQPPLPPPPPVPPKDTNDPRSQSPTRSPADSTSSHQLPTQSSTASTQDIGHTSTNKGGRHPIVTSGIVAVCLMVIAAIAFVVIKRRRQNRSIAKALHSPHAGPVTISRDDRNATMMDDTTTAFSNYPDSNQLLVMAPPGSLQNSASTMSEDPDIVAMRIPMEKLQISTLISRGGFGEVYRGSYKSQPVAVKRLLPDRRKDLAQIDAFLAEAKMMGALEHERIVRFIGVAWDSLSEVCVVSEFMDGGDLRSLLTRFETVEHRLHGFDHDKIKIALHVAHALTYLHSLSPVVLHRDFKSKNILLNSELDAKLTDFGVSRERSDATMTAGVGSSLWMAPEVMLGERYDEKADVFSFGVVLSELDTHLAPYAQVTEPGTGRKIPETAILQMVTLGKLSVQFSEYADSDMVGLGRECVAVKPEDRPTAAEVLHRVNTMWRGCVSL